MRSRMWLRSRLDKDDLVVHEEVTESYDHTEG